MLIDSAWKLEVAQMPAVEFDETGFSDIAGYGTNLSRPNDRILESRRSPMSGR